jgi:radical SAM superfamily enzyme YgiQ (UPF0313 family)
MQPKKVLLINPPFLHTISSCQPKIFEEGIEYLPPLGLMYIAGYLRERSQHRPEILDCQVEEIKYEKLGEEIKKRNPAVVGITAMTFTLIDVIKTAEIVKKTNPNIKVILGGPHVNIYPEETMETKVIDFIVFGEGEEPMKELLDNINDTQALYGVKGIVFRDGEKIINTGQRELIKDLDSMPFPARDLTPYKKYSSVLAQKPPVTTMFTSRGCPYKCLFCDRPHLGKVFRSHSAKYVIDEMKECKKLGINEIMIYDDTFTIDRQRVVDICNMLIEEKIDILWDVRARVNTVDEELLKLLAKAGCKRIHYGVEAGTEKILNVLRKGITLGMAEKAFYLTKKAGIQTLGYFMIGSPEETLEDIEATKKFIKKISPDYIHVTVTTPFPATELYYRALREGVIKSDAWKEFARNPNENFVPPSWNKELDREELFSLLKQIYRSFYFRPSYILGRMARLGSVKELTNKALAALRLLRA